ncbi:MAG: outer membrane beta-barrel protein [Gammaproteobacteria bacterium]
MKRALSLLAVAGVLASANAAADTKNAVIGSIYLPKVEVDFPPALDASPDALQFEFRHSMNRNVWLGAMLTTGFGSDDLVPGLDVEVGNSLTVMVGAQAEFAHHVSGWAFLGYGKAEGSMSGAASGDADGNGVAWGLGVDFRINDQMLVNAGYVSLFDGTMDSSGTDVDVAIAGPRVGIGFTF